MITATPVALNKKDRKLLTGRLLEDKKSFYKLAIILCFDEICSPAKANSAAVILSEGGLPRARSSVGNPSRRIWVRRARMIMWGHPPAQEGQRAAKFPAQNYAACLSAVVDASDVK